MTTRVILAARIGLGCAVFGLTSCESEKAHEAAIQFAFSWEQTVKAMGLTYLSDLREVEKMARHHEPEREVIQAEGSDAMRREAAQLDTLVLYVARCLDANIGANIARPEGEAARAPLPVEFPDPALNRLLGLGASDGENPQKAVLALHEAISRFARVVGVDKQFQEARKQREQQDSRALKSDDAELGWAEIRESKIKAAFERKTKLAQERKGIEKEALVAQAPLGFADAKWLMSPEEVRSIRPNATMSDPNNLSEVMECLGRPARVSYNFDNGFLVTVIITFRETTASDFQKTQHSLQETHGNMPAPHEGGGEFLLSSHYKKGRFAIWHLLQLNNIEQVVFARDNTIL